MQCEWPTVSLRDAGITLIDCDHRTPPPAETGYPYVAIPQLVDGRISLTGVRRISDEHFAEWTRKASPKAHDVVLSRRCNPGESAFVPPGLQFAVGQNLVLLRADGKRVFPPFLRWLVRGPEWWAQVRAFINVGAVFESLKCKDIPNFALRVPPLPEQHAIASVLGALDDKIDLNRRMCQTLEEMARALFKSWFVDFDPVRAKMEGRDPGLPKEIADLFPSRLVDSELGLIPEGWRVAALDAVMDVNPPRALKRAAAAPHLDMGNMPTHGHCACDITERPYGSGARFVTGDTLLARITPCLENGKTAFVDFLPEGVVGWGSTEYIVIRPKPPTPVAMGYYLARTTRFREYAIQSMNGSSGRQRVPSEAVARYRLPLAPEAVSTGFGRMADPLMRRVRQATNESKTLAALRDTLLPKLISGELRVPASLDSMQETID